MANVLDKELIQYFTKLDEPQKKSLLEMIKSFLRTPRRHPESCYSSNNIIKNWMRQCSG